MKGRKAEGRKSAVTGRHGEGGLVLGAADLGTFQTSGSSAERLRS